MLIALLSHKKGPNLRKKKWEDVQRQLYHVSITLDMHRKIAGPSGRYYGPLEEGFFMLDEDLDSDDEDEIKDEEPQISTRWRPI